MIQFQVFLNEKCLSMFSISYRSSWFLIDKNGPYQCTCSLVALLVLEMIFWPAWSKEKSTFLKCIQVPKHSGYFFLFPFIVLLNITSSITGVIVSISGSSSKWSFFASHIYWNVCNRVPELFRPRMDWFWSFGVFCWKVPRLVVIISAWTNICKRCSIVFHFWQQKNISMISFWGILTCFLRTPVLFSRRSFKKLIDELYECHPTSLRMFLRLLAWFFCE